MKESMAMASKMSRRLSTMSENTRFEMKLIKKESERHRLRVKHAKCRVDTRPSKILTATYLRPERIREDRNALAKIKSDNISLMMGIEKIRLTQGKVRSFFPESRKLRELSKVNKSRIKVDKIEDQNIKMGCRLMGIKSRMSTRTLISEQQRKLNENSQTIPAHVLRHYKIVLSKMDYKLQHKLLRPRIYFDLYVSNIRPLGRIIIQMYTEACPELVLQFVRLCTYENLERLKFIRIFPTLWIEGEVQIDNHSMRKAGFAYCMKSVDHGIGPGVLSFSKSFLNGFTHGLINFSMSFKALPMLNGERIPFGVVTHGQRVLDCLQDYGTKNGKTKKEIIVVKCDLIC